MTVTNEDSEAWVNVHKSIDGTGVGLKALCENVQNNVPGVAANPRMVALARTHFQQGLMCLRRSLDEEKW